MSDPRTAHVLDARYMSPPEPFEATMAMLGTLQPGESMLLRLFREPHPLYSALRRQGHRYETTLLPDGTFDILITRAGGTGRSSQEPA
jgi:tRNA 2-thiouridine synthesizing protein A